MERRKIAEREGATMSASVAKFVAITTLYLVVQWTALHWVAGGLFTFP